MDKNNIFRKTLVIGIIVLFVGASVLPSISGNIEKSNSSSDEKDENMVKESSTDENAEDRTRIPLQNRGNTLYVGGDGSGNYTSIQGVITRL